MDLLEQMKTFVRIVETGHLSSAARSRKLSVAAVSRQLSALEQELGAALVVRSTRQLAITEGGRRWYRHCVELLHGLETARADVTEGDALRGPLVISAPVTYGVAHIVPRIERLARTHPGLTIELRLEDHAIDLVGAGVDIAVRAGMALPDSSSVIAHRLVTFRRALVAAPGYLRKHGTPRHPDELVRHQLLVQSRAAPSFTRWSFTRDEQTVELLPRARLASSSPLVLREWALASGGIALIPEWLARDLRRLLPDWLTPPISVYALHRAELRGSPRIRAALVALAAGMSDTA